jgi:hypothetical protein
MIEIKMFILQTQYVAYICSSMAEKKKLRCWLFKYRCLTICTPISWHIDLRKSQSFLTNKCLNSRVHFISWLPTCETYPTTTDDNNHATNEISIFLKLSQYFSPLVYQSVNNKHIDIYCCRVNENHIENVFRKKWKEIISIVCFIFLFVLFEKRFSFLCLFGTEKPATKYKI